MSAATLASPAISEFAAAVRSALSDLGPDEVDDLTDGLEADLTDRLEDADAADLGDPAAYAEELRAAAGLPHRDVPRRGIAELRRTPGVLAGDLRAYVARTPALSRVAGFFVSLRPVWWVFRAAAATALATAIFGGAPEYRLNVIFGIAALIVSVQFGRGRWLPFAWMKALLLTANVVLVVSTPFVVAGLATQLNNATYALDHLNDTAGFAYQSGLAYNGSEVSNIFAYDAQGNPLTDVQLYDQDGKPLDVTGDPTAATLEDGHLGILVPSQQVPGRLGWNVYPLGHVSADDLTDTGAVKHSVTPTPAKLPFAAATPLAGAVDQALAPSPTVTAAP